MTDILFWAFVGYFFIVGGWALFGTFANLEDDEIVLPARLMRFFIMPLLLLFVLGTWPLIKLLERLEPVADWLDERRIKRGTK